MPNWRILLFFRLIFLCSSFAIVKTQVYEKCLSIPEVTPKKYFVTDEKSLTINLETSSRLTHLLATHIFYIFAKEVLGYPKVTISKVEDYFDIEVVMERLSGYTPSNFGIPPASINLEVWTSPEFDPFEKEFVKEVGSVGPPGRFGWYIPRKFDGPIKEFYQYHWNEEIQEVHWSYFLDEHFASKFALDGAAIDMINNNLYRKNSTKQHVCPDNICQKSMYTPPQCRYRQCAVLLTPEYESSKFLIEQINEIGCFVKILWLGKNLKPAVWWLNEYYSHQSNRQSFMFFHWFPGDIVMDENKFISVKFKNNELYNFTNNIVNGYKYEMHRLVKMVWSKVEVDANPLFLGVRSFKLRKEDYEFLLNLTITSNRNEREIACEWMKNNSPVWANWKKNFTKPIINIGGIFPMTSTGFDGGGIMLGARAATDFINENPNLLPDYELKLLAFDGKCQPESVMSTFLDLIVNRETFTKLVGVLGPACTETVEPIAAVSKRYHVLVISYGAEGSTFSDRSKYPYFFRTIGENLHYKHVYVDLFKHFGWKRLAALTEDGQKYTEYISLMSDDFPKNDIAFVANKKFPRGRNADDMRTYLVDLKRQSVRIIIADVADHDARMVMCEAYRLEMTAKEGYVWFLPVWLNKVWYDTNINNNTEKINCSTAEMIEAANGYFSLTHAYYAPDDAMMQENKTVGQWKEKMRLKKKTKILNSEYAGFAYDAVWTYALALNQLVNEDSEAVSNLHSEKTSKKMVEYIQKSDFHGVSGHIKFRGGPSRFSTINIVQWFNGTKNIVGNYYPNVTDDKPEILGGDLILNGTKIRWLTRNGEVPEDGTPPPPSCALEALAVAFNVECQTAVIILNVIVAGVLLIGVVAVCYYMKRKYDSKVEKTKNYMRSLGIPFDMHNASDLDKWEVRRECVVINRKLGEGAFGTVYGGEVSLDNDNNWTAAAVKTLKVGSTTEEKLDFLSEAEAMKRFDHKNIVKLLGVCTKEEPVYTIMEFMLYGDLKTYLLARRHLVKSDIEESEEVSPKRLTNMALDVARGLSYLTEMKYVHRDIASRNCLINAQRSVKIGDFGMTRAMFDNDYYKFTRRGMLPVRWMSPESLALGVFTPASDIWSFGILLYEIITFGNFPFQGKSNTQVLEIVKEGQTLEIPKGTKPQLVGLMKSCWKRESKDRPSASQIVEFLANNPRLLSPCLDVPISSVQIGDSDQLELSRKDLKVSPTKSMNGTTFQAPSRLFDDQIDPEGIPLEVCCAKEPLLGQGRASSSNLLSRLVVGSKRESEEDDEYLEQNVPDTQVNTNV